MLTVDVVCCNLLLLLIPLNLIRNEIEVEKKENIVLVDCLVCVCSVQNNNNCHSFGISCDDCDNQPLVFLIPLPSPPKNHYCRVQNNAQLFFRVLPMEYKPNNHPLNFSLSHHTLFPTLFRSLLSQCSCPLTF